jgi:molybdate transport system substrate-binding protein
MKKHILLLSVLAFAIGVNAQTIRVAAAGNLRYILNDIKAKYVQIHPKANIVVNLGASGALFQQISNGAEFDVFMAADKVYPDKLKSLGMVVGNVKTYAFGKLVLWSNTVDVSKGLVVLSDKAVVRIAIAKPDVAPYGDRAVAILKTNNMFDALKGKIVYADNIAQSLQFAQTGNAEVSFTALALVMVPELKGNYFVVDTNSYKPVEQAMVQLKSWKANPEATQFMQFVLSTECKPIFEKYGFIVP